MKLKLGLLFIVIFILITLSSKEISNFTFISRDDGSIEINEPVIINKNQNKIKFKNIKENSIRVNKICIHDTINNETSCLTKEDLGILKNLPTARKSSFCLGDTCVNEIHAKVLRGEETFYIKSDDVGNTSLQSETLNYHTSAHMKGYHNPNIDYLGRIPYPEITNKNPGSFNFNYQQYKLFGADRKASADPTAFGASLSNQKVVPIKATGVPFSEPKTSKNSDMF